MENSLVRQGKLVTIFTRPYRQTTRKYERMSVNFEPCKTALFICLWRDNNSYGPELQERLGFEKKIRYFFFISQQKHVMTPHSNHLSKMDFVRGHNVVILCKI